MSKEAVRSFTHHRNHRREVVGASTIIKDGLDNRVVHVARMFRITSEYVQLTMYRRMDFNVATRATIASRSWPKNRNVFRFRYSCRG